MTVRLVSASDLAEGRTVVDDRLVESPPGGHSETYSGNHLRDRYDDGQRPAQRCDADVISKRVTDETCQEGSGCADDGGRGKEDCGRGGTQLGRNQ